MSILSHRPAINSVARVNQNEVQSSYYFGGCSSQSKSLLCPVRSSGRSPTSGTSSPPSALSSPSPPSPATCPHLRPIYQDAPQAAASPLQVCRCSSSITPFTALNVTSVRSYPTIHPLPSLMGCKERPRPPSCAHFSAVGLCSFSHPEGRPLPSP